MESRTTPKFRFSLNFCKDPSDKEAISISNKVNSVQSLDFFDPQLSEKNSQFINIEGYHNFMENLGKDSYWSKDDMNIDLSTEKTEKKVKTMTNRNQDIMNNKTFDEYDLHILESDLSKINMLQSSDNIIQEEISFKGSQLHNTKSVTGIEDNSLKTMMRNFLLGLENTRLNHCLQEIELENKMYKDQCVCLVEMLQERENLINHKDNIEVEMSLLRNENLELKDIIVKKQGMIESLRFNFLNIEIDKKRLEKFENEYK